MLDATVGERINAFAHPDPATFCRLEHRGHEGDPLYSARRTLHTGTELLTDKQIHVFVLCSPHRRVQATTTPSTVKSRLPRHP